jgi:Ca2+-binding EF-hand superfamily protein
MEEGTKMPWEQYQEKLKSFDYTEEQIEAVKEIRENCELMTFEQFTFLISVGAITRTAKLRKARNMYDKDGKLWYLNHYNKQWNYAGFWNAETEE